MEWALHRDADGRIDAFAFQDDERRTSLGVSREEAERAVVLVGPGGRRWSGADASARVLRLLPGWGPVGRLLTLPLVRPVAAAAYTWIADHRELVSRVTGLGGDGRSGGASC